MELTDIALHLSSVFQAELGTSVKRGMQEAVYRGRWPGLAPLGYRNAWQDGKKFIVIDPDIAPIIREAFCWASERKYPLRTILKKLTARGLRSRRERPISLATLHRVLTNPFYTGIMLFKGERWKGQHEPLVDAPTFARVQENLRRRCR